jgi:hypothetical protein
MKQKSTMLVDAGYVHEPLYNQSPEIMITNWKPEVAAAISQIENYIDAVIRNAAEYTRSIKRKKHVDVKVIRPRGYIAVST